MAKKLAVLTALIFLPQIAASVIINVPEDYPTIQEAVDNCASGDEIVVSPGIYEPVYVDSLFDVTFTGAGIIEPRKTVIDAHDSFVGFWVWYSEKIVIQGFEIRNCWESCLGLEFSKYITVRNNFLHDCNDTHGNGLSIRCCDDVTVNNNIIVDNFEIAAYVDPVPEPNRPSKNLEFINNTIGFIGGASGADGVTIAWSDSNLYYVNNISVFNSDFGLNYKFAVQTHSSIIKYNDHYGNNYGPWGDCIPTDTCIYVDPQFTGGTGAEAFFLQEDSPCIDAGDPTIFDPDGTRSDIGAFYYDQGQGIFRIALQQGELPSVVPASGGAYRIDIRAANMTSLTLEADIWTKAYGPGGIVINPLFIDINIPFEGFEQISLHPLVDIPAGAPPGEYRMAGFIGAFPASIADSSSFFFRKAASEKAAPGDLNTSITSYLEEPSVPSASSDATGLTFNLSPNPFNSSSTLSLNLNEITYIKLKIYDILGRTVDIIAEGYYPAGPQNINLSSSNLSNGIYFAVITAGGKNYSQKFAVVK